MAEDGPDFNIAAREATSGFRDYLMRRGVPVTQERQPRVAKRVHDAIKGDKPPVWTLAEVRGMIQKNKDFRSQVRSPGFVRDIMGLQPGEALPEELVFTNPIPSTSRPVIPPQEVVQQQEAVQQQEVVQQQPVNSTVNPSSSYNNPNFVPPHYSSTRADRRPAVATQPFTTMPLVAGTPTARQLTDLIKMYPDGFKYNGGAYESLESKLAIFRDRCFKAACLAEARQTDFLSVIRNNPDKTKAEALELLIKKVTTLMKSITRIGTPSDAALRDQLLNSCRGVEECSLALFNPAPTFTGVCGQLRSAIGNAAQFKQQQHSTEVDDSHHQGDDQYWTDRTYNGQRGRQRFGNNYRNHRGDSGGGPRRPFNRPFNRNNRQQTSHKKCYYPTDTSMEAFNQFVTECEGFEPLESDEEPDRGHHVGDEEEYGTAFFTSTTFFNSAAIDGPSMFSGLRNQLATHFTKEDFRGDNDKVDDWIIPDSGAAEHSTVGIEQYLALKRFLDGNLVMNTATAGQARIRFGNGTYYVSKGTIDVATPLGNLTFHVMPSNTPFLLCLADIDKNGIKFDNFTNELIKGNTVVPIVRKWGHACRTSTNTPSLRHSAEFKKAALSLSIDVKEMPIEAHNSIGKVERYHSPLRRAYKILRDEGIAAEVALQLAVKAINDTAGPDGFVPTLLVFGAYPRVCDSPPPSATIARRAEAVRKAMEGVRQIHAKRQVNEASTTRNGPNATDTVALPLQSMVRVWHEKDGWQGPFRHIASNGTECTVNLPHGPRTFRSTVVKPYHDDPTTTEGSPGSQESNDDDEDELAATPADEVSDTIVVNTRPKRKPGRPKRYTHFFDETGMCAATSAAAFATTFVSAKEEADLLLAVELHKKRVITTPGGPFQQAIKTEITGLVERGVFRIIPYGPRKHAGTRLFNSRIANEVKGKNEVPYEESRLVIQGYADDGKEAMLTQSPTIQRASQRLILAIAPALMKGHGHCLWLRDIT
ncbi:putative conserved hypothetical protein [Colletotrichum sublineola]|uniref:Integrase catalytic domain-containing protein n=1 Tax=Colletotrichum sublineola TaxID=1173701 RepID=A0A066XGS0_COLSU|nr:putative conserved hypothetical protein [Colletotrichum sublineola]